MSFTSSFQSLFICQPLCEALLKQHFLLHLFLFNECLFNSNSGFEERYDVSLESRQYFAQGIYLNKH
jgi:sulfur relay (sulfurtransferase) complex TusBCD TusD component (DsrE family)